MDQPVTRAEFNKLQEEVRQLREQRTEEIKTVKVEVASQDAIKRLEALEQGQQAISQQMEHDLQVWLDVLQENYTEHKDDIAAIKAEVATIKAEVTDVKAEVASVKSEVASVKAEMATKEDIAAIRAEMATKDDLTRLATANRQSLAGLEERLIAQMISLLSPGHN